MRKRWGYEPIDETSSEDYYAALELKQQEANRAEVVNQILDTFSPADRKILLMISEGKNYREIAKCFLISTAQITKIKKRFSLQVSDYFTQTNRNSFPRVYSIGVSRAE